MHWIVMGIVSIAITFALLGSQSVWITVLNMALKLILGLAALFAVYLAINHIFRRKP